MSYRVTQADPLVSADVVAGIWADVFGPFSLERHSWLYRDNPAGEALLCLLQRDAGGQPVGSAALFPRWVVSRGHMVRAGIAGDLMVQRGHRCLGPAVQLQRALLAYCAETGMQLAYGFPNSKSAAIAQRVGYRRVGDLTAWLLPLHTDHYLRRYIAQSWLRRPLAWLLDRGLSLRPGLLMTALARRRECALTDCFGADFDEIWSRIASGYSLVGEKTSAFLDWRYRRCPSRQREAFVVRSSGGTRLLGYVIFSVQEGRAEIADFAHDPVDLSLAELLSRFTLAQRKAGANTISVAMAASDDVSAVFRRVGFSCRGVRNPLMLFVPPNAGFRADELLTGTWYLVRGDNDT